MIEKCAEAITGWLINSGAIENEERGLYVYATYSFLISISPLFLTILCGIFMGQVIHSIVFIIPFMVIRKFSGGYHAKKSWVCMLCSCLLLILCIYLISCIKWSMGFAVVTFVSAGSLMIFSPIDSENRRLDLKEKQSYKKMVFWLVGIAILTITLLYLFNLPMYAICISMGLILTAGLQVPCIIQKCVIKEF